MTHELIDSLGAALEVAGVVLLIAGLLFALVRTVAPSRSVRAEVSKPCASPSFDTSGQSEQPPQGDPSTSSGRADVHPSIPQGERVHVHACQINNERFLHLRHDIGRAILLGLEVLVAADIVRSVTLAPTMGGLTVLATLVVIRTFLSWSLALELDGRWPWQRSSSTQPETTP
jgi:uncharacterized membrane protein